MKLPTKAQWDEIAEAFGLPLDERNDDQRELTFFLSRGGICEALTAKELSDDPMYKIYQGRGYWWDRDDAGDRERAFFCCMMAAITDAGDMESMIEENK